MNLNPLAMVDLLDEAPFGIYVVDAQFRIVQMNKGAQEGAFRNVRPALGKDVAQAIRILWPDPVASEIISRFRHTLETGEPYSSSDFINARGDVEAVEAYEWRLHRIVLPDGQYGAVCYYFDSTKLREAERALRKSEERFRALVTASSDVVYRMSPDWSEMRRLDGRNFLANTETADGDWAWKYIYPEDWGWVKGAIDAAIAAKGIFELEHRVVKADGTVGWTFSRAVPLLDGDGEIVEWFGAASDVTGRKLAEEALRQSEQRLGTTLEASAIGAFEINLVTGEGEWNTVEYEILGIKPGDVPANAESFFQFVHPEDVGELRKQWEKATRTGEFDAEFRVVRADGQERWLAGKSRFAFDDVAGEKKSRRPSRFLGVNFDITDRKRAEEALRASQKQNELLAGIVRDASQPMAIGYADGSLGLVNRAFEQLTGYSMEELRSVGWMAITPEKWWATELEKLAEQRRTGQPVRYEKEYIRKDGSIVPIELLVHLVADTAGNPAYYYSFVTDISERKAVAETLLAARRSAEQARASAEQASKAKDHFLAVLSHELRNPLNPVLTTAGMLLDDPRFDPQTREQLEIIYRNVDLEARLIDDLLDITRIERGKFELDRQPIELTTVIHRALEVCKPDFAARQLGVVVDIAEGPYELNADAARLQQVFWNLFKNAVKFTPPGGTISIRCQRDGDGFVKTEVSDTGVGLEADAFGRIFNAFEQAERSITQRYGGLGLGLTICKAIMEMHGGSIAAHSMGKNRGSTFTVRLPLEQAERRVEVAPMIDDSMPLQAPKQRLRILLVEDHVDTARVMLRLLSLKGHHVEHAADVVTALALADKNTFDLLLSDLGLPDGLGLDLIRMLRAKGNMVPAIALSGYGHDSDIQRSLDCGFAAHLTKPLRLAKLEEAIARTLNAIKP